MTTAPLPNIYQRMLAVMRDISYVQKSEKTVNGQYRFVTHDAVTGVVREALVNHGIVATTDVLKHSQDGNRTEVDVRVRFVNVDKPDDLIAIDAFGYGIDPQDKGPGKAISYAVKYAYLKAFALETGDDPERDNIDHKADKPKTGFEESSKGVSKIELDGLTPAEQEIMRVHADTIIDLHNAGLHADAAEYCVKRLDNHEKQLAVWALLPSNVRSSIKKNMPARKADLATQP